VLRLAAIHTELISRWAGRNRRWDRPARASASAAPTCRPSSAGRRCSCGRSSTGSLPFTRGTAESLASPAPCASASPPAMARMAATCVGIPPVVACDSTYLIILIPPGRNYRSACQASTGGACASLAALISRPRLSASARSERYSLLHSSEASAWDCGAAATPLSGMGGAPLDGNGLVGEAPTIAVGELPFTRGTAESLASPAPCASASPQRWQGWRQP
jgi:hypothetical protein